MTLPDGRFIAFTSPAANVVPGVVDDNAADDVFVRDIVSGTTTMVSVGPVRFTRAELPVGDAHATISADGRYVLFYGWVADPYGVPGLYVRDRVGGTTTLVDASHPSWDWPGEGAALSGNGRYGVYESTDTGVAPTSGCSSMLNVYLHDVMSGTTQLVSVNSAGTAPGGPCGSGARVPHVSDDGRFVVFESEMQDLVGALALNAYNPGQKNVFVRDMQIGATTLVSWGARVGFPDRAGDSEQPLISADGSVIYFASSATDLVSGDLNDREELFRFGL